MIYQNNKSTLISNLFFFVKIIYTKEKKKTRPVPFPSLSIPLCLLLFLSTFRVLLPPPYCVVVTCHYNYAPPTTVVVTCHYNWFSFYVLISSDYLALFCNICIIHLKKENSLNTLFFPHSTCNQRFFKENMTVFWTGDVSQWPLVTMTSWLLCALSELQSSHEYL